MNPLIKLQECFEDLREKEGADFIDSFIKYLMYVKTTDPFSYYVQLKKHDSFGVSVFFDALESNSGTRLRNNKVFLNVRGINSIRPFFTTFHHNLVAYAKKQGFSLKVKIIISNLGEVQKICTSGHVPDCYVFRGKNTNRYKIIEKLFNLKGSRTTRELLSYLNSTEPSNLRKNISAINKNFREKTRLDFDLILKKKQKNQNSYFLNRNDLVFEMDK